jgi:DNA invertase Pin-like site-specific DNA recombinase
MQEASGLGLEGQRAAIERHLAAAGLNQVAEYVEVESGRNNKRPQLQAALAACHRHKCVLVISRLDRLSRNVHFLSGLMESGVEFVACDMPSANKLTLHVLAAVAEAEAEMISARTRSALEAARKRGVKLGGLRRNSAAIGASGAAASVLVRQHRARENARNLLPAIEEMGEGLSQHEIARRLNDGGFNAPRGGQWSAAQVGRVLALADGR